MKQILILLMVAALATAAQAAPVTGFTNLDFDDNTQNIIGGFDEAAYDVPGWQDYNPPLTDSGSESGAWWPTVDGYAAFCASGDGAYNTSSYVIQAGDVFIIDFWGMQWEWTSTGDGEWTISLYYDDPANVIGSFVQGGLPNNGSYTEFTSPAIPATVASEGGLLGILLESTGGDIVQIDEITIVTTPVWYISPADGADLVPINTDLVFTIFDPNIVEIDVQLGTEDDPNLTTDPLGNGYKIVDGMEITTTGEVTIDVPSDLAYDTPYYWKVIGYEPNYLEEPVINNKPVPGPVWSFETITAAPYVEDFNNITLTNTMLPATLVAHLTDSNGDLASVDFTLLTDDVDFPAGATFTEVSRDVSDLYNPSITVTTDGATDGYFKVKLTATDATAQTAEQIAEVALFTNDPNAPCDARQWMWDWTGGEFNSMDFDQDCDVDLVDFAAYTAQWLDDINLKSPEQYINLYVPYGPVVNGVVNGNFELGDFTGWWTSDSVDVAITDVSPLEGSYSAEWTTSTDTGNVNGTGIAYYFNVQASTAYTVTLQISGGDGYDGTGADELGVRTGSVTNFVYRPNWTATTPPAKQTMTLPFITGPDDEGKEYELIIFGKTVGTYYKVDDVQISPSPY